MFVKLTKGTMKGIGFSTLEAVRRYGPRNVRDLFIADFKQLVRASPKQNIAGNSYQLYCGEYIGEEISNTTVNRSSFWSWVFSGSWKIWLSPMTEPSMTWYTVGYRGLSYSSPSLTNWPAPEAELKVLHFSRLLAVFQPSQRFLGYHGERCVTSQKRLPRNFEPRSFDYCHANEGSLITWLTKEPRTPSCWWIKRVFFLKVARIWYTGLVCIKVSKWRTMGKENALESKVILQTAWRVNKILWWILPQKVHFTNFLSLWFVLEIRSSERLKGGKRSLIHMMRSWLPMIFALTTDNFPVPLLYT